MPEGTTRLKFKNIELTINYEYSEYFHQTYDYPAEGGEFYITAVYVEGVDIIELIQDSTLDQITEEYLKKFNN
jgi:hypothetical protein